MWKIMIADDEPKIRRGLRAQIERMGLRAEVTCEADDGQTALETAEKCTPDILLVDINMPFLNGLEFIQRLRKNNADARIIVVTGCEEFEYAKRALALGVQAYLLKPVEVEELKTALESAIEELEHKAARDQHYQWALGQLAKRREYLLEQFLCDVIEGQYTEPEILLQLPYFDIPPMAHIVLMLISAKPSQRNERLWDPLMRQFVLADVLKNILTQCASAQLFCDVRGNVLILCDVAPNKAALLQQEIQKAAQRELQDTADVVFATVERFEELSRAYDGLLEDVLRRHECSSFVQVALAYIQRSFDKVDLSLDEVAKEAKVNPSYLSKVMKQEMGMSFAKYLTCVRINQAVKLMQDDQAKIKDVSLKVGYATPHYFSTAFKKLLGLAPMEYRSEEKGK